jgi:hypothetical protein
VPAQVETVAVGELAEAVLVDAGNEVGRGLIQRAVGALDHRRRGGLVVAHTGDEVQQAERGIDGRSFRCVEIQRTRLHRGERGAGDGDALDQLGARRAVVVDEGVAQRDLAGGRVEAFRGEAEGADGRAIEGPAHSRISSAGSARRL